MAYKIKEQFFGTSQYVEKLKKQVPLVTTAVNINGIDYLPPSKGDIKAMIDSGFGFLFDEIEEEENTEGVNEVVLKKSKKQ
jgi:hypothetical protein